MLTTFNSEAAAATSLVLRAHGKPDAAVFAMAAIGFEGRCRDDVLRVLGLDRELRLVSDLVELRYELEKWGGDGK